MASSGRMRVGDWFDCGIAGIIVDYFEVLTPSRAWRY
jgi:hypothetical protein